MFMKMILSQDDRLAVYGIGDSRKIMKKAAPGKECGLKTLIVIVPLPYAGITQVRYEGRPNRVGHLSEKAPLAL